MRVADLVMAIAIAVFSVYLIYKSLEGPATWVEGSGPGGGFFPLWLSVGMLLSALAVMVRWVLKTSPLSRSTERFMQAQSVRIIGIVVLALFTMLALIHVIGVYGAVPLFLIFYLRYFGRHRWKTVGPLALGSPVVMFFLFEIAMKITLPKGYTEPLFFPLYDIFL